MKDEKNTKSKRQIKIVKIETDKKPLENLHELFLGSDDKIPKDSKQKNENIVRRNEGFGYVDNVEIIQKRKPKKPKGTGSTGPHARSFGDD